MKTLIEESKGFYKSEENIDEKEKGRLAFISNFPLEKIGDLTVDEYVQGTGKNSFCYWLEFKKILFGIGGGNASKFGIYKAKDGNYYTGAGVKRKQLSGNELEQFFLKLKSNIIEALKYTENNEIEKIKTIDTPIWNMVLQKILSIYYPDKFITVGSADVLIKCANDINLKGVDLTSDNLIQINYECKKALDSLPEFKDWSYIALGGYIWETYSAKLKEEDMYQKVDEDEIDEDGTSFLQTKNKFDSEYGPSLFENFIDNLRKIVSKLNLQPNDERIVYSVRHNRFNFIIGQRYCYNIHLSYPRGVYGYISSEKLSEESTPFEGSPKAYYTHFEDFSLASEEWEALIATMRKELKRTNKSSYWKSNNKEFENYVFEIEEQAKPPVNNKKMITPTNTILYGPPGTGKTYNTVNKALEIIDSEFLKENIDNRQALNNRFRGLRFNPETGEGQVAFITFHQSLSYEDFIEGIKPRKSEGDEEISYEVCDGIFKAIALKASDKKVVVSFDEIYKEFIGDVMEKETFSLKTPVQKKPFDVRINGSGNCVAIPQTETATQMVVTKKMISDFLVDGTVRDWKPYLSSIAEYIKANYSFKVDKEDNANKPYVIIIDEINRGNISQIFGELITLIEPDKRKGQAEEIEVILPYSKERFSVPSNLHIIGTMNTADRSVEALDTALRRRFSFMEMNPKPEKLSQEEFRCEGIDLKKMLSSMNGRIEKLLDRDYCIGHSYFMTIKNKQEPLEELKFIFQNKILPLLQEYFYGDWGKIRLIVGKEFVQKRVSDIKFLDMDGSEDYDEFDERPIYSFTDCDKWTLASFQSIYEQS